MKTAKVTLTRVFRGEQETQFGERVKVGIKIQEESVMTETGAVVNVEDKYLTALFKPEVTTGTEDWEAGKQVEISVTEKNGYFNFKVVGFSIEDRLSKIEKAVFGEKEVEKKGIDAFEEVKNPNDIDPQSIDF